ncbi:MAG: group 1 truncated hemoglobin [Methylotenera sp.]|nr:MAG: group 1 truncated hemoglobin [Methylotenera sp.]
MLLKWLGIILLTFALCSCSQTALSTNPFKTRNDASLFTRIGGLPVLTKIVDQFIDEVATSPRTKRSFDGIKLKALKESIVAQLCKLTGGGCVYEGETMLNSHRDAKITEAEFDAFVDMFRSTLNRFLHTKEKNELLKILAPMKRDIVTK